MKNLNILTFASLLIVISFSSCLKDPGNPVVTASKSTVAVNEEVTLTLSGAENYTCLQWRCDNCPDYTIISGGTEVDLTIKVKPTVAGTYNFETAVKNCKDVCTGKCRDEYAKTTITVQ